MRIASLIVGLLLLAKGVLDLFRLPAAIAAIHSHVTIGVNQASTAFFAGEATGQKIGLVFGVLLMFVAGTLLVVNAAYKGSLLSRGVPAA